MIDARVEKILGEMTLEEKIDYIGGDREFYIRPIERLGLPEIKMADGPTGVRNYGPSTQYPASIALAATWDADLAKEFGVALASDCRARGVHIILAPGVNIYRSPLCGRNFEYRGEDPYLAGHLATATIHGVEENGVLATVKHFVANNQEYNRHHVSSEIDERTLREIYLPAFEIAVKDGKVACVMNAYNLLNGVHCTQDPYINNDILKSEWGFDGILMSDWNSVYDSVGAANGGLDLEMPYAKFMNKEDLLPAIKSGDVSEATIDDKVRRILRTIIRAGFLEKTQEDTSIPKDDPASAKVALKIEHEGIVLLKNENSLLPLDDPKLKRIAVVGMNADGVLPVGGGSSHVGPFHQVSFLDGIRAGAGEKIEVLYDSGGVFPSVESICRESKFEHVADDGSVQPGLAGVYFANMEFDGEPAVKRVSETIFFNWNKVPPEGMPKTEYSIRWTGRMTPETDGDHLFVARSDDGIRIWLDGEMIIEDWGDHGVRLRQATRNLKAGQSYDIRIDYYQHLYGAGAEFGWMKAVEDAQAGAVAAARTADAAIVFVGLDHEFETEGGDRSFQLPGEQDVLVQKVVAANPNTIVVLHSGGAVDMTKWVDRVPAVLQAWYPGQEGGTAVADVLFGNVNPSGKLPATFERNAGDNPSFAYYHSEDDKTTHYTEGIFVGYRGYDAKNIAPLFCFGHGLSYTTFAYSDLSVTPKGKTATVTFTVKNTGSRAGAEVAQIYVGDPKASVPRPVRELKGFARVMLNPGESKTVTAELDERAFSFYDVANKRWLAEPGEFVISVGASSRDIRLNGTMELK